MIDKKEIEADEIMGGGLPGDDDATGIRTANIQRGRLYRSKDTPGLPISVSRTIAIFNREPSNLMVLSRPTTRKEI